MPHDLIGHIAEEGVKSACGAKLGGAIGAVVCPIPGVNILAGIVIGKIAERILHRKDRDSQGDDE